MFGFYQSISCEYKASYRLYSALYFFCNIINGHYSSKIYEALFSQRLKVSIEIFWPILSRLCVLFMYFVSPSFTFNHSFFVARDFVESLFIRCYVSSYKVNVLSVAVNSVFISGAFISFSNTRWRTIGDRALSYLGSCFISKQVDSLYYWHSILHAHFGHANKFLQYPDLRIALYTWFLSKMSYACWKSSLGAVGV